MAKKTKKLLTFPQDTEKIITKTGHMPKSTKEMQDELSKETQLTMVNPGQANYPNLTKSISKLPPSWKALTLEAKQILCKLIDPCPACGVNMIPVCFTGETINIVCDSYACTKFRQPARYLRKTDIDVLINRISNLEMIETTGILGVEDKHD